MQNPAFNFLKLIRNTPALILLLFVYLIILPRSLSYDHAWMFPEEFSIKNEVLKDGPQLGLKDLRFGLNWRVFEFAPRTTRPLSSYFDLLDTKFRSWLWQYRLPHPSLSLTWLFSLFFSPLLLYLFLKNIKIGNNAAIAAVCFYLVSPPILSCVVMLSRPAKPMAYFSIILCLYFASELDKRFSTESFIPRRHLLCLLALMLFSFFWDEVVLLVYPAVFILFPKLLKGRSKLVIFGLIPVLVAFIAYKIIPQLTVWAGYEYPWFCDYCRGFKGLAETMNSSKPLSDAFFANFIPNTRILILDSMGMMRILPGASLGVQVLFALSAGAWGVLFFYALRSAKKYYSLLLFLLFLIVVHNFLITMTIGVWGPFYYGGFFSVFFAIYLAWLIHHSHISKYVLTACMLLILANINNCLLATSFIYKKHHVYSDFSRIRNYFESTISRFDTGDDTALPSGREIRGDIYQYWSRVRLGRDMRGSTLPRELGWLPIELRIGDSVVFR
ncbi:MAG TPA: hypothetical protein PL155_06470 [Candidatus Omnitrophota bacterium]|nr:hypothetical protein [Candidatus Omnitrophota bacterium]HPD83877.1 hypothetical protein [Candidatus Omnitrophota bacterium]HRZ02734.1 hypothetical protein [Candidatus Omnitrophota bacterium]